jgi:thiamine-phosphate pyrophosphorylase
MTAPRLIAITDTRSVDAQLLLERLERVCASAVPGSVMLQLRDRELSARARLSLGRELCAAARRHGQLVAVNDRADLALVLGADGLHLGEASLSVADARRVVGSLWISAACHDPERPPEGADAILLSPVLEARKGNPALGTGAIGAARAACGVDVYALGGVDAAGARRCLEAGAAGVAAVGAVLSGGDPRSLLAALGIARP